jgi:D-alanyl-D-alanine carboxypeptidase (penicillin-binding protein 5/6)
LVAVSTAGRSANAGTAGTPTAAAGGTAAGGTTAPGALPVKKASRRRLVPNKALTGKTATSRKATGKPGISEPVTHKPVTTGPATTRVVVTSVVPTTKGPKPTSRPAAVSVPHALSYVLVDVDTGYVLAGYNEHLRLSPASLTKVLTALIAVTYLAPKAGVAGTTVSENVYPNRVGIEKGVAWPLPEVLQSLLVFSANDAAYAIADRISGTLRGFAPVMERSAAQIGMSDDPVFHDPAGLDGPLGFEGGNLVSARDMAIAGRDLLAVPQLAEIVREKNYHFVDPKGQLHWLPSMNFGFLDTYPGAIGIKTGFTDRAGECIMAAAVRGNRTMLAVVMNGYNPTQSAIDLLNYGFATPVAGEPKNDRLPPRALPSPPRVVPLQPVDARKITTSTVKSPLAVKCAKDAAQSARGTRRPSPAPHCSSHRAA